MIATLGIMNSQLDYDALLFINAASITNSTQILALSDLVFSLKVNNLWSKMKAIYPFVGGTENSHKFNLKDPRDLDAAFRITFTGTWTHSANGAQGNGTNNVGNTFFNPRTHLTTTSTSHGSYIRNNYSGIICGCNNSDVPANQNFLYISSTIATTGNWTATLNSNSTTTFNFTAATETGLVATNRSSSTSVKGFYNGSKLIDTTNALTNTPNFNYYIGCRNNAGTAANFSAAQFAFHYIGDSLTDSEHNNLYTIINKFQTILGRNV